MALAQQSVTLIFYLLIVFFGGGAIIYLVKALGGGTSAVSVRGGSKGGWFDNIAPGSKSAAKAAKGVERAESREENIILKELSALERAFSAIVKGKKSQQELEAIKGFVEKIRQSLKNLKKLEGIEMQFVFRETVPRSSGTGSELRRLLADENNLINALESLLEKVVVSINNKNPSDALRYIREAKSAIRALIRMNKKEIRQL